MKKRILSFTLCLTLLLGLLPVVTAPVLAEAVANSGYENGYAGGMAGDGKIYAHGIDASVWQGSEFDFNAVKDAGYDYVILRAGTTKGKDTCFETFYTNARAAGLDIGAYFYSYATTTEAAQSDADKMLQWIDGKTFEYPVYFNYEDASQENLSAELSRDICLTFCNAMADAGYLTGVYIGRYRSSLLPMDEICATYEIWVSHIFDNTYETKNPEYSQKYGMYQYTYSKTIEGISEPVDANVVYKDYPAIVKQYGFSGYEASGGEPTLTLEAPTLEFKDTVHINAFYTAENIQDAVEMGMITYSEEVTDWSVDTAENVIPGAVYDEASGRYYASSQGIHAKNLGDTVYLAVYAKLSDGSYIYSQLASYSPVTYALNQLQSSTDNSLKQLVAAMLNYGTQAQLYFGHNTSTPANSSLTAEQMALPESYHSDMVSAVAAVSAQKQGALANNQGFAKRYPSISFEGAFSINYFFTPSYKPIDGITLYYWNTTDFDAAEVLSIDNASGSVKLEGEGTGEYRGDMEGIAAKNLSDAVYVAAVYSDGTTTWTSGVLGYSIGTYCLNQAAKGSAIAELAMATAVYGYYAKQYFG